MATRLQEGASYEAIARELGCSASKVAWWAQRHGLVSAHTKRHSLRGPLAADRLRELVERRLSLREMAAELDRSPTAVRYWLKHHQLETPAARRKAEGARAAAAQVDEPLLQCPVHGRTRHVRRDTGYRCAACRSAAVSRRRRDVKRTLLRDAGGACALCGYHRCVSALHFHHVDPSTKRFGLGSFGVARSLAEAREEAKKCVLLCANCHAEVESGVVAVSLQCSEPCPGTGRRPPDRG